MIEVIPELTEGSPQVRRFVHERLLRYTRDWGLPVASDLDKPGRALVFERDEAGQIVGFATWFRFPTFFSSSPKFFVDFVWVEPDRRGLGVATRLIGRVREQGDVMLRVLEANPFRASFEQHTDWTEVGTHPRCRMFESRGACGGRT